MDVRTVAVIALSNRPFDSLAAKVSEAVRWLEIAAAQGAEMVVLPEMLNQFSGDGSGPADPFLSEEQVRSGWGDGVGRLLEAARRLKVYLTIPVVAQRGDGVYNSMYLASPEGEIVWCYDKVSPTPDELDKGIRPGRFAYYDWRGVKVGGAICFDTCFPENLTRQADEGAGLILIPSLWPGGSQLNTICKLHSVRIALAYPAWSRIIDIDGLEVTGGGMRHETLGFGFGAPVYTEALNFDRVALFGNGNQEQIVSILEKYGARVRVSFDQENCLWFLESRDPSLHEQDLMREFSLVSSRDYFARCARRIAQEVGR